MSIARMVIRQRDFSAGEIDPDAERRDDTELFKYGVKEAKNVQSIRTGGLENRFGRQYLYSDDGVRDDFRLLPNEVHSITFSHLRATVRNAAGVVVATLTAPWTAAQVDKLVWAQNDNQLFIAGPTPLRPHVIEVNKSSGAWSIYAYDFRIGLSGIKNTAFYRYATIGVTLRPSDRFGAITIQFSAPVLSAGHVGTVFRYGGKQLQITGVSSATDASAVVLEPLNPTVKYMLSDVSEAATFAVGQIVQTSVSGVEGEVINVNLGDPSVTIIVLNRWRQLGSNDRVVGPSGDADIASAGASFVTPGATTQWDEQFMSNVRGWPQSVAKDAQRVIFSNFPQLKSAIIWSTTSDPFDLQVNADATGAIFELIDADCQVFHVVGGYDEFAITDIGVFYIPISPENPLKPGSVEFRRIYSGEVSDVKPIEVTEGVLFVDESKTGIYAITATGQTARPYAASEITEFHRHVFNDIKSLAANSGTPQAASRQIFVVNGDGTVVIGQYSTDRNYVGWLPWDGQGEVSSVVASFGNVVFSTTYYGTIHVAERINVDRELDCSVVYTGAASTLFLANKDVQVMADGFFYGTMTVGPSGTLPLTGTFSEIYVGFEFDWFVKPNLQDFEGGESYGQRLRRRKVAKALIKVRATQEFRVGNKLLAGYNAGDDTALPMPKRSGVFKYRETGRSYDPEYQISKSLPGRFKLIELTTEVTV